MLLFKIACLMALTGYNEINPIYVISNGSEGEPKPTTASANPSATNERVSKRSRWARKVTMTFVISFHMTNGIMSYP